MVSTKASTKTVSSNERLAFHGEKARLGQAQNVLTPPSEMLDSTMVQTKVGYIHGNSKLKVP